jgi:hypothetical protein
VTTSSGLFLLLEEETQGSQDYFGDYFKAEVVLWK